MIWYDIKVKDETIFDKLCPFLKLSDRGGIAIYIWVNAFIIVQYWDATIQVFIIFFLLIFEMISFMVE